LTTEQQIANIYQQVQQLLKEREELKTRNQQLQKQLAALQEVQHHQHNTIAQLQQQTEALKLMAAQSDPSTKQELEKTINRYLKEIDKAIALLAE
jgi:cell division septum initiation protein DivIVA